MHLVTDASMPSSYAAAGPRGGAAVLNQWSSHWIGPPLRGSVLHSMVRGIVMCEGDGCCTLETPPLPAIDERRAS